MENYTEPTQSATAPSPLTEELRGKASTAMVLSIVGLALLILPGFNIPGLVLSIIGLSMAVKNRKLAAANGIPEHSNNNAAFVCGLIGVIVHGLLFVFAVLGIILLLVVGVSFLNVAGPSVGEMLTESAPAIHDAIRDMLPPVESVIRGFIGLW